MGTFKLPDVGEGLTEAEIVRWLVEPGDEIDVNQMVCEIETAKAVVELPSPFAGTVEALHAQAGETLAVGSDLITVAEKSGERTAVLVGYGTATEPSKPSRTHRRPVTTPQGTEEPPAGPPGEATKPVRHGGLEVARSTEARMAAKPPIAKTKPPVRRLARELGIDLAAVDPTGPDGVITRADVERAAAQRIDSPAGSEHVVPIRGVMRSMAEAMVKSAFSAPHVTVWMDVEVSESMRLLERLRAAEPERKWSPTVLAAAALIRSATKHRMINATFDDDAAAVIQHPEVNFGMAVATQRGLLLPSISSAQNLSLAQLSDAITDITSRGRDGTLGVAELTGATITLTNVGVFGVDGGTPIIPPGQVAILCLGRVVERAWVVGDSVQVRPVVTLTLSFDHRCIDGQLGSTVLSEIAAFLQDPAVGLSVG